jgi:hypothetical protein
MILQNRKTKKIEVIRQDEYARLKELGWDRKFTVLDKSDPKFMDGNVDIPPEVREFMANMEMPEPIEPIEPIVTSEVSGIEDVAHDDFGTHVREYKRKTKSKPEEL